MDLFQIDTNWIDTHMHITYIHMHEAIELQMMMTCEYLICIANESLAAYEHNPAENREFRFG